MVYLEQDRQLLDAFRKGERQALETVYLQYAPGVALVLRHGFALRSSGGAQRFSGLAAGAELENGVQEVFLRAFSEDARQGYDGLRSYAAYLAAIARNWVLNELRKQGTVAFVAEPPDEPADAPSPEAEAADGELFALLAGFRAGLTEELRSLWELRFERQLPQEAAARELGRTRIQLRRMEGRLKGDLLRVLKEAGYLDGASPTLWAGLDRKKDSGT